MFVICRSDVGVVVLIAGWGSAAYATAPAAIIATRPISNASRDVGRSALKLFMSPPVLRLLQVVTCTRGFTACVRPDPLSSTCVPRCALVKHGARVERHRRSSGRLIALRRLL